MNVGLWRFRCEPKFVRGLVALSCAVLLTGNSLLLARPAPTGLLEDAVKVPADQLDALVAPIALYPDNLLSQTLVASTYPLEIIQLQQWLDKNQHLASHQQ